MGWLVCGVLGAGVGLRTFFFAEGRNLSTEVSCLQSSIFVLYMHLSVFKRGSFIHAVHSPPGAHVREVYRSFVFRTENISLPPCLSERTPSPSTQGSLLLNRTSLRPHQPALFSALP